MLTCHMLIEEKMLMFCIFQIILLAKIWMESCAFEREKN